MRYSRDGPALPVAAAEIRKVELPMNGGGAKTRRSPCSSARWWSGLAAALAIALAGPTAAAAQSGASEPLPPPDGMPFSRLTVTPAEFARWMGEPPPEPPAALVEPEGRLGIAPPPAPSIPPAPILVTPPPPPAPALDPDPAPGTRTGSAPMPAQAPTAPPAPPVIAAPPPEEPRVATLPPDSRDTQIEEDRPKAAPTGVTVRILFPADLLVVPEREKAKLDEVVARMKANPDARLEIVGYASELADERGRARRRSLDRVLSVRKYLIERGVTVNRMNVRALGDKTADTPRDRVDILLPPT
jgi:outer membrane protein OmpA-like peptidoglycan-associated protein